MPIVSLMLDNQFRRAIIFEKEQLLMKTGVTTLVIILNKGGTHINIRSLPHSCDSGIPKTSPGFGAWFH
jgi:hypothetical protein